MARPPRISVPGPRVASTAPRFTPYVLGSRPPSVRSPRIKPAEGVTQYAKQLGASPLTAGFGNTGKTGES